MQDEARELLRYASSMLGYPLPDDLPEIRIEPDLDVVGQYSWEPTQVITLRGFREGNLYDASVLLHEACHHLQFINNVPMDYEGVDEAEVQAITVQLRWLQSKGEDARTALSYAAIHKMTNDPQFSKLEWL